MRLELVGLRLKLLGVLLFNLAGAAICALLLYFLWLGWTAVDKEKERIARQEIVHMDNYMAFKKRAIEFRMQERERKDARERRKTVDWDAYVRQVHQ